MYVYVVDDKENKTPPRQQHPTNAETPDWIRHHAGKTATSKALFASSSSEAEANSPAKPSAAEANSPIKLASSADWDKSKEASSPPPPSIKLAEWSKSKEDEDLEKALAMSLQDQVCVHPAVELVSLSITPHQISGCPKDYYPQIDGSPVQIFY